MGGRYCCDVAFSAIVGSAAAGEPMSEMTGTTAVSGGDRPMRRSCRGPSAHCRTPVRWVTVAVSSMVPAALAVVLLRCLAWLRGRLAWPRAAPSGALQAVAITVLAAVATVFGQPRRQPWPSGPRIMKRRSRRTAGPRRTWGRPTPAAGEYCCRSHSGVLTPRHAGGTTGGRANGTRTVERRMSTGTA